MLGIRRRLPDPPLSPHPPTPCDRLQLPGAESIQPVVTVTGLGISPGHRAGWPWWRRPSSTFFPGRRESEPEEASFRVLPARGGAGEEAQPGARLQAGFTQRLSRDTPSWLRLAGSAHLKQTPSTLRLRSLRSACRDRLADSGRARVCCCGGFHTEVSGHRRNRGSARPLSPPPPGLWTPAWPPSLPSSRLQNELRTLLPPSVGMGTAPAQSFLMPPAPLVEESVGSLPWSPRTRRPGATALGPSGRAQACAVPWARASTPPTPGAPVSTAVGTATWQVLPKPRSPFRGPQTGQRSPPLLPALTRAPRLGPGLMLPTVPADRRQGRTWPVLLAPALLSGRRAQALDPHPGGDTGLGAPAFRRAAKFPLCGHHCKSSQAPWWQCWEGGQSQRGWAQLGQRAQAGTQAPTRGGGGRGAGCTHAPPRGWSRQGVQPPTPGGEGMGRGHSPPPWAEGAGRAGGTALPGGLRPPWPRWDAPTAGGLHPRGIVTGF